MEKEIRDMLAWFITLYAIHALFWALILALIFILLVITVPFSVPILILWASYSVLLRIPSKCYKAISNWPSKPILKVSTAKLLKYTNNNEIKFIFPYQDNHLILIDGYLRSNIDRNTIPNEMSNLIWKFHDFDILLKLMHVQKSIKEACNSVPKDCDVYEIQLKLII